MIFGETRVAKIDYGEAKLATGSRARGQYASGDRKGLIKIKGSHLVIR